jgi:hypothetical protein
MRSFGCGSARSGTSASECTGHLSRAGWSIEQAARGLGVSVRTYRELEDGERSPNFVTWDRIYGCD